MGYAVRFGVRGIVAAAMMLAVSLPATAETLLTIEGLDAPMTFDRPALEAIGAETITTTTIWTEGEQTFTGVPLKSLVALIGVTDGVLVAKGINDYAIEFPVEDALKDGPLIAYLMNGEPMSVRDKGPLWIVYPYSSSEEFQSEVVYSRSIWQLDRIEIQD